MVAIECRFIPCTNTRPDRWVAETCNGHRLLMSASAASYASGETGRGDDCARVVAQALADKMEWSGKLYCGGTKAGYVFVFADKGE